MAYSFEDARIEVLEQQNEALKEENERLKAENIVIGMTELELMRTIRDAVLRPDDIITLRPQLYEGLIDSVFESLKEKSSKTLSELSKYKEVLESIKTEINLAENWEEIDQCFKDNLERIISQALNQEKECK